MAKQFGVSEEAVAGLQDPERYPFAPDESIALRFADAMTRGSGEVPDELFDELKVHYSEAQIIEIAAVIGIFNYFNRVNNALKMDVTLTDPEVLEHRVIEMLAREPGVGPACEKTASILSTGRNYLRTGIYIRKADRLERMGWTGTFALPEKVGVGEGRIGSTAAGGTTRVVTDYESGTAGSDRLKATRLELTVPILVDRSAVGIIDIESGREPTSSDVELERRLVERIAELLAPLLATA